MEVVVGLRARVQRLVTDSDTATALGSGDVPVLASPRLLAWAEAATVAALNGRLDRAETSVGSRVVLDHHVASAVGATITLIAELVAVQGRVLRFSVTAQDGDGRTVGSGEVTRIVVDRERFLSGL